MQKIKELIQIQLNDLFVAIPKLVQNSINGSASSTEVLSKKTQQKLDQQIKAKWHDLKDGVDCLCQSLPRAEQFKLMQFTEDEFNKRRKEYNQQTDKKAYKIKIFPHTKRFVLPRKIESTESRLEQGHLHTQVLKELRQYWQDSFEYWDEPKYLWGNLCLSFIYISGCADEQHLVAIQKQLQETIELSTDLNYFRLYRSDYKKITNPLLLHYRVETPNMATMLNRVSYINGSMFFFNPYAQLILQYLKKLKATHKEYRLQQSIEECILESLTRMGQNKSLGDLKYQIKRRGFRAFNDVQMVLEFNSNLSLDLFLSNVQRWIRKFEQHL